MNKEKKYPIKWEYKSHSYQIGDIGDYDGYWEVTNGKDSLITKEDYEDIEKDLQAVVDLLNNTYANFTFDRGNEAALEAENRWLKSELEQLKARPSAVWVKGAPKERKLYHARFKGFISDDIYDGTIEPVANPEYWQAVASGARLSIKNDRIVAYLDESTAEQPVVLTQERADFIREANGRDLGGMKEQPVREVARVPVFVPCAEGDPDCCGGYTSNDGRSLCYVKEILIPASAFKQPPAEWSGEKETKEAIVMHNNSDAFHHWVSDIKGYPFTLLGHSTGVLLPPGITLEMFESEWEAYEKANNPAKKESKNG